MSKISDNYSDWFLVYLLMQTQWCMSVWLCVRRWVRLEAFAFPKQVTLNQRRSTCFQ